jgi:hypothetical protein
LQIGGAGISAFVSAYLDPITDQYVPFGEVGKLAARGVIGGLAARASGGRLSQGFKEGVFEGVTNALTVPIAIIVTGVTIAALPSIPEDQRQAVIDRVRDQLANLLERAKNVGGPEGIVYALTAMQSMGYPVVSSFTHIDGVTLMNPGEVWKYGETINPGSTYSYDQPAASMLQSVMFDMLELRRGRQMEMKAYEKLFLLEYFKRNGTLPPGNSIFR